LLPFKRVNQTFINFNQSERWMVTAPLAPPA
jgi:hypothetical protein